MVTAAPVEAAKEPEVQVSSIAPAGGVTMIPDNAIGPSFAIVTVIGTTTPSLAGAVDVMGYDAVTENLPSFEVSVLTAALTVLDIAPAIKEMELLAMSAAVTGMDTVHWRVAPPASEVFCAIN